MSWTPRYSSVPNGTSPYDWSSPNIYQCTWYAYSRVQEGSGLNQPPCWYSGSGSSGFGAYTNAKEWLNHYRDPWQVKSTSYTPVVGDIIVFTGTYGHVVVVEAVNGDGSYVVSDYNLIAGTNVFGIKYDYEYPNRIQGANIGTGNCIGALHNPNITPSPDPPVPPTPTTVPDITITPSSASAVMQSTEDYKDFTFNIVITGIPNGESASGGNTYPDLSRVYNTGWSYSTYVVSGVTYRSASKTQTLRYYRVGTGAYTTTKYMYFSKSFSNGSINSTTPIYIDVKAKSNLMAVLCRLATRRRRAKIEIL